jgi:peptidoglycan lytic transglycosylase
VRRRTAIALGLAAATMAALVVGLSLFSSGGGRLNAWHTRAVYPLDHAAAIRRAARHNGLDPALVAAVMYGESGFDARARSPRGAVGLMQVLPETAAQIAHETGGVAFVTGDLEDAVVNIRYGCYYLRRAFDLFGGRTLAAVAAYNAGVGRVTRWVAAAHAAGHELRLADIPYAETRAYVGRVLSLRRVYRTTYGDQLGTRP